MIDAFFRDMSKLFTDLQRLLAGVLNGDPPNGRLTDLDVVKGDPGDGAEGLEGEEGHLGVGPLLGLPFPPKPLLGRSSRHLKLTKIIFRT